MTVKLAFHDTDTDILARMSARMSVSVSASWNAGFTCCGRMLPLSAFYCMSYDCSSFLSH